MDVVGSEIGLKMRSAIKAKLTELGCYVDDELPDYVMVMVANKRTRAQMEDDLQLFLGDNTELFVNWLHQVLKKLQEVTVAAPKPPEPEKIKEKERSHSKDRKTKEKKLKDKTKKSDLKKAKKKEKEKEKSLRKKEQKKAHKKKKSKDQEMIRPNIPPLLMNMEKHSEPSITDVFAGQILKNHGILLESTKEDPKETKPIIIPETKRPIVPIIDPATITATGPSEITETVTEEKSDPSQGKAEQLKEINDIEAKIQGLRQKLAEQLDSMSEDEDFLNIRTEAEELMNDFAEDVFLEISEQAPSVATPPSKTKSPSPTPKSPIKPVETPKETTETLPQIELKLPKRPIRERLGAREEVKKVMEVKQRDDRRVSKSPESFTPERELEPPKKSARSRIGPPEQKRKLSSSEVPSEKTETSSKRLTSRVSVLENRSGRSTCASVVRVRPRPRVPAPAPSLLLRAVADANKSMLNIPPKVTKDPQTVKRALVLPMRRLDAQKILISVPGDRQTDEGEGNDAISLGEPDSDDDKSSKVASDAEKEEYVPPPKNKVNEYEHGTGPLTMKVHNPDYAPSRRLDGRTATKRDDSIVIEAINIHNPTIGRDKNTQFIVTMDGFNPNAFLAKKLQTEGILNDDEEDKTKADKDKTITDKEKTKADNPKSPITTTTEMESLKTTSTEETIERVVENKMRNSDACEKDSTSAKTKVSETNDKNDDSIKSDVTHVIGTGVVIKEEKIEKRPSIGESNTSLESPSAKKRKSSPIVFDIGKKAKENEKIRERTESVGSDNQVIVTTTTSTHKYDTLPPLAATTEKKPVWCRAFPQCRYGSACVFVHPRCKFAAACTRRNCPYSHAHNAMLASPAPVLASHVVPAANYKTISAAPLPAMCKYYPACTNAACHYYHPKPCRFGKLCANKLECNFYHADVPSKWRYPV